MAPTHQDHTVQHTGLEDYQKGTIILSAVDRYALAVTAERTDCRPGIELVSGPRPNQATV